MFILYSVMCVTIFIMCYNFVTKEKRLPPPAA
jgi:hypothetical protein